MVAGGRDGTVRFIDLATGSARRGLGRHDGSVVRAAFSRDGRTAVTAGEDNRMIVWDVRRAAIRETLQSAAQITGLAIARTAGRSTPAASTARSSSGISPATGRLGRVFGVGPGEQRDPSFDLLVSHALSPDGRLLAVGRPRWDRHADRRADAAAAAQLPRGPARAGLRPGVHAGRPAASPSAADDGYLALRRPAPGRASSSVCAATAAPRCYAPTFSADGRLMLTVSGSEPSVSPPSSCGGCRPGDRPGFRDAAPSRRSSTPPRSAPTAARSPSPGRAGVEIIDTATMRRRATLPGSETVRILLRFTPDGRYVVGGSVKGWTRLWSTKT